MEIKALLDEARSHLRSIADGSELGFEHHITQAEGSLQDASQQAKIFAGGRAGEEEYVGLLGGLGLDYAPGIGELRSAFDEAETVDVRIDLFDKPRIGFNEIYRDDKPFGDPFAAATVRLRKRSERWTSETATGFGGHPHPVAAFSDRESARRYAEALAEWACLSQYAHKKTRRLQGGV